MESMVHRPGDRDSEVQGLRGGRLGPTSAWRCFPADSHGKPSSSVREAGARQAALTCWVSVLGLLEQTTTDLGLKHGGSGSPALEARSLGGRQGRAGQLPVGLAVLGCLVVTWPSSSLWLSSLTRAGVMLGEGPSLLQHGLIVPNSTRTNPYSRRGSHAEVWG